MVVVYLNTNMFSLDGVCEVVDAVVVVLLNRIEIEEELARDAPTNVSPAPYSSPVIDGDWLTLIVSAFVVEVWSNNHDAPFVLVIDPISAPAPTPPVGPVGACVR